MSCIFCSIIKGDIPSYKLYEDDNVVAILDISQATKGHSLIITKKHFHNLLLVDEESNKSISKAMKVVSKAIEKAYEADGFNILSNCEEAAGQTVFHAHVHIIPRYVGDEVKIVLPNRMEQENLPQIMEEIKAQM
jgi:histidine triad (HIT) family protein